MNQLNKEMEKASQKHTQELSNITCELRKQKESEEHQRKMQAEKNRKSADLYAKQAREKWISPRKKLLSVAMLALSVLGVLGTAFSFTTHSNPLFTVALTIATILAIISTIDTVSVGKRFLMRFLEKRANQYETKVRENKLKEYNSLTQIEKNE